MSENMNEDRMRQLVEKVTDVMSDLGLYMMNVGIGTDNQDLVSESGEGMAFDADVRELIASGEARFVLTCAFGVNEMAWRDRILYPEQYDLDLQFRKAMPSQEEMLVEQIKNDLAESGGDYMALLDDEDDDDVES